MLHKLKLTDLVQRTLFLQTVKVTKDKVKLRNLHIRDIKEIKTKCHVGSVLNMKIFSKFLERFADTRFR